MVGSSAVVDDVLGEGLMVVEHCTRREDTG